jgi:hypothetical protein
MIITDFKNTERLLLKLLNSVDQVFNQQERAEVQEFINVGEFGLALDTLIDIIVEENKQISENSVKIIKEIAAIMLMDESLLQEKLEKMDICF